MKLFVVSFLFLNCSCSTLQGSTVGALFGFKKKEPSSEAHLKETSTKGEFETPCINLPYIDQNFPELLHETIRVQEPKVDPVGAYKVSLKLLESEEKEKSYAVDTKSVKYCKEQEEVGYIFKVVKQNQE